MFIIISSLSYFITNRMIPTIQLLTLKADLFGYDINKKGKYIYIYIHTIIVINKRN